MHTIMIYSKPGCHLCEKAKETVDKLVGQHATVLVEVVNIQSDPELEEKYKNDIPVIFIDGVERFRHTLDPQKLAQLFYDELGENLLGFN